MANVATHSADQMVQSDVDGLEPTMGEIEGAGLSPAAATPDESPGAASAITDEAPRQEATVEQDADAGGRRVSVGAPDRINLLDEWDDESGAAISAVSLVKFNYDETVVIPFTGAGNRVFIHFCDDPEIQGYVRCNAPDCLLCRIGRSQDERLLLPVYLPTSRSIGVLAISPSSRPGALRPQIMPFLRSNRRVALLIRRLDRVAFQVSAAELHEDVDDGAEAVAAFARRWDAGQVDLTAVYQRLENRDLAELSRVAPLMKLKRIAQ